MCLIIGWIPYTIIVREVEIQTGQHERDSPYGTATSSKWEFCLGLQGNLGANERGTRRVMTILLSDSLIMWVPSQLEKCVTLTPKPKPKPNLLTGHAPQHNIHASAPSRYPFSKNIDAFYLVFPWIWVISKMFFLSFFFFNLIICFL